MDDTLLLSHMLGKLLVRTHTHTHISSLVGHLCVKWWDLDLTGFHLPKEPKSSELFFLIIIFIHTVYISDYLECLTRCQMLALSTLSPAHISVFVSEAPLHGQSLSICVR